MCCGSVITRRSLLRAAGSSALAAGVAAQSVTRTGSGRIAPVQTPLVVQPVLLYETPKRVPERSWRQWGSIQTEAQAGEEKERISRELAAMGAPFPLKVLPVELVRNSVEQAAQLARRSHDVMLVYAAGGGNRALEALTLPDRLNLLFVRHRSGAMYVWYEIAHPR